LLYFEFLALCSFSSTEQIRTGKTPADRWFREMYVNIETNGHQLNQYKSCFNEEHFVYFKDWVINSLNQTLIKLELYFDLGKEPTINFLKWIQVFNREKGKYLSNSVNKCIEELDSIREIDNLMVSGDLMLKSQFITQFKSYLNDCKSGVFKRWVATQKWVAGPNF
jgi:hypothetical protein